MGTSQAKNNMKKTRKTKVSHLQTRRNDDGVEEDQRWASEMKNKEEEEALRTTMVNGALGFQWAERIRPIKRTISTGSGLKPVLKGDPLAPVCTTNRC